MHILRTAQQRCMLRDSTLQVLDKHDTCQLQTLDLLTQVT